MTVCHQKFKMTVCHREFEMTVCHREFEMTVCHRKFEMTTSTSPENFWKWKHSSKKEPHFENESMFFEKWLILNLNDPVPPRIWNDCVPQKIWDDRVPPKIQNDCVPQKIWDDRFNFSGNLSHFDNENTFRKITTFWKWKLILKPVLKMKACFLKSD